MKSKIDYLFCFITTLITFVFFMHTLNYSWKYFDEQIIFNETILPIATSLSQVFEYIKYFGIKSCFEASNTFYSTVSNLRCDPINNLILLFINFFLKKNAFAYHTFSLLLHLISTSILFLLLNKISINCQKENEAFSNLLRLVIVSSLTLLWALHPVNIESVLFAVNWSAILTYTLCLIVMFYFINNNLTRNSVLDYLIVFILFLIPLFNSEYSVTLPLILFAYAFANYRLLNPEESFLRSIIYSLQKTSPLILAGIIFTVYFLISPVKSNLHIENSLQITAQRLFWLSPQIFFHFIKLIFLPVNLSIDQTGMVKLASSLTTPYSAFCTLFMYSIILLLIVSFINIKNKFLFFFFIGLCPFLFALLPFLHIISPTYCLASERYLYFPLFMLVFGIAHVIFYVLSRISINRIALQISFCTVIIIATFFYGAKAYSRTLDWKDSITLFGSTIVNSPNDLLRVLRLEMLGSILSSQDKNQNLQVRGQAYLSKSVEMLEDMVSKDPGTPSKTTPQIIKEYGLDTETMYAKAAYLFAFTKAGLDNDKKIASEILIPIMKDKSLIDTPIIDLYLTILFSKKDLNEAERILTLSSKRKISPATLIGLSIIQRHKYKDLLKAEGYLLESFKYFPYDISTLESLKNFYSLTNKKKEFAYFAYLHGLRTHSLKSFYESYKVYKSIKNDMMAAKANKNMEILKRSFALANKSALKAT